MEQIRLSGFFVLIAISLGFQKAQADLSSPFSSSVNRVSIPNAHFVGSKNSRGTFVMRGQGPTADEIDQLIDIGVERVLIFKNQTKGEVTKEISELKKRGIRNQDILHVEMPWKDITNFQKICEMTLESLLFIEESVRSNKNIFFHCSMGEDRTGYLAGLWGLWNGNYKSINNTFKNEMCARGYEAGDPKKPAFVVKAVQENLTPAFMKMVSLLAQSRQQGFKLNQIQCPKNISLTGAIPTCK